MWYFFSLFLYTVIFRFSIVSFKYPATPFSFSSWFLTSLFMSPLLGTVIPRYEICLVLVQTTWCVLWRFITIWFVELNSLCRTLLLFCKTSAFHKTNDLIRPAFHPCSILHQLRHWEAEIPVKTIRGRNAGKWFRGQLRFRDVTILSSINILMRIIFYRK